MTEGADVGPVANGVGITRDLGGGGGTSVVTHELGGTWGRNAIPPLTRRLLLTRFALVACVTPLLCALSVADEKTLSKDEQAVLDLTNAERKVANLPALKVNEKLLGAARAHAANMAKQGKLEHVLDGKSDSDRTKAAGYESGFVGENIAWNSKDAKATVELWMNSQGHKDNLLSKAYTEIGVAVARNEKGEPYWVQVFGKP